MTEVFDNYVQGTNPLCYNGYRVIIGELDVGSYLALKYEGDTVLKINEDGYPIIENTICFYNWNFGLLLY